MKTLASNSDINKLIKVRTGLKEIESTINESGYELQISVKAEDDGGTYIEIWIEKNGAGRGILVPFHYDTALITAMTTALFEAYQKEREKNDEAA